MARHITTEAYGLRTTTGDDTRTNERPVDYASFCVQQADVLLHGSCCTFQLLVPPRHDLIVRWVAWLAVFYYGQTKLVRDELVTTLCCCCCLEPSQGADFTGKTQRLSMSQYCCSGQSPSSFVLYRGVRNIDIFLRLVQASELFQRTAKKALPRLRWKLDSLRRQWGFKSPRDSLRMYNLSWLAGSANW